ncbi:hypothetical protein D7294_30145 [Streptomyces hoynatensis]|uniref:Uncharacterized protein n=1 Tax=Streptomyces hoynatensis TaxID=1141874 RepID=A0A3A9YH12_9ACTN|nr:hypothetical protein D7294_30145 [Streptomyces hoynatensis]
MAGPAAPESSSRGASGASAASRAGRASAVVGAASAAPAAPAPSGGASFAGASAAVSCVSLVSGGVPAALALVLPGLVVAPPGRGVVGASAGPGLAGVDGVGEAAGRAVPFLAFGFEGVTEAAACLAGPATRETVSVSARVPSAVPSGPDVLGALAWSCGGLVAVLRSATVLSASPFSAVGLLTLPDSLCR